MAEQQETLRVVDIKEGVPVAGEVVPSSSSSWPSYLSHVVSGAKEKVVEAQSSIDWQGLQSHASAAATTIGEAAATTIDDAGKASLAVSKKAIDYISSQTETYEKATEWAYQNREEIVLGTIVVVTAITAPSLLVATAKPIVMNAVGSRLTELANRSHQTPPHPPATTAAAEEGTINTTTCKL